MPNLVTRARLIAKRRVSGLAWFLVFLAVTVAFFIHVLSFSPATPALHPDDLRLHSPKSTSRPRPTAAAPTEEDQQQSKKMIDTRSGTPHGASNSASTAPGNQSAERTTAGDNGGVTDDSAHEVTPDERAKPAQQNTEKETESDTDEADGDTDEADDTHEKPRRELKSEAERNVKVGTTTMVDRASLTCEGDEHAIDARGKPCMDLRLALARSLIYVVDRPDVKYMMCAIPKNGCSYHLSLLHRIYGEEDYHLMPVIHDSERKATHRLSARDSPTIAGMLSNASIPKYVVVRNPMRRTLSAYLDKVQSELQEEDQTVEHFHNWVYENFPDVAPEELSWRGKNPHWKPQLEFCGFKKRNIHSYFKIFHVEEPDDYLHYLYDIVPEKYLNDGWARKQNISFRDFIVGPRRRTQNTSEKFDRYFNKLEVFDHLAKVLNRDITNLGYEAEVRLMRESLKKKLGQ